MGSNAVGICVRLGTRASALARWQADWVAARLREQGVEVILVPISTAGDRQTEGAIKTIGAQGVFTKELQQALLDERIDLAVHSLKDLPSEAVAGLCLAAVPERGLVGDAFVSRKHASLDALPPQAVLGTGSLRRRAQVLHGRSDLVIHDVRGNVDTRLRKLDEGQYDAILLAQAGLERLGFADRITERLSVDRVLPAVGQGALGLETRTSDARTRSAVGKLDHADTHAAVLAERAMLAALQGGCLAPIAGLGRVEGGKLTLSGRVIHPDGATQLDATATSAPDDAIALGRRVAEALIAQGAAELIQASREA